MAIGILCGILAGAMWGLVFIVPEWLHAFSPLQLSVGRYLAYGTVSLLISLPLLRGTLRKLDRSSSIALLRQSITGNLLYYILLSFGVQLAGVAPTSLIIGLIPVGVTLIGSRDHGALPLRQLALPLAIIAAGIVCINLDLFAAAGTAQDTTPLWQKIVGVLCATGGLCCWTWYAIDNARFLVANPRFSGREWSALYGMASGLLALLLVWPAFSEVWPIPSAVPHGRGQNWPLFWMVNLMIAVLASLLGNTLWNAASRRLPLTLSGQMIVFETLFALLYGFVYVARWPRPLEWAAMVLLTGGVIWSVRAHSDRLPD